MWRHHTKGSRKYENARRARDIARMEGPAPDYPLNRPELCHQLIHVCFEFGEPVKHVFNCYKTRRVDLFRVTVDDVELPKPMGMDKVHVLSRKAFPRMLSSRNL